jgi:hypothetical protein
VLCHHFTAYGCPEDDPYTGIVTRYEESDGGEVQYLTVVFNGHVETYRRVHPDDWTTLDGFGNVVITVARGEG